MKESGCEISEWILKLKNPTKDMKRNLKKRAVDRDNIEFDSVYDQEQRKKKQKIIESSKKRKSGNAKSNPPSIS
jgi:ATP-dependent RNA helicase DDX52/ROK1